MKPKIKVWPFQWIGYLFLLTLPVLSIFGYFDENMMTEKTESHGLEMSINYPSKLRYGEMENLRIEVRNNTKEIFSHISISLSRNYLENFEEITFTPNVNKDYLVSFESIPKNQSRYVDIQIKGKKFGNSKGQVMLTHENRKIINQSIKTFIFP